MHKHKWIRSRRKHHRPPRIFVQCEDPACGLVRQAVISNGYAHIFHTGKRRVDQPMKNYSIRLPRKPTKEEVKYFQAHLRKNPAEE